MATYWVKSGGTWSANPGGAGNSPTAAGTSHTTVGAAITAGAGGGDYIRVSDSHAETGTSPVTWSPTTTSINPVRMYGCADATGNAVTAIPANGQVLTTTGNDNLTIQGNWYIWGMRFHISGAVTFGQASQLTHTVCELCRFQMHTGDNSEEIEAAAESSVRLISCEISDYFVEEGGDNSYMEFEDCTWVNGAQNSGSTLFDLDNATIGGTIIVRGGDWSAYNGTNLVSIQGSASYIYLQGLKIPSGITLVEGAGGGSRVEMYSCNSADQYYMIHTEDVWGRAETDTGVYRSAKYDGTNGYSIKMTANTLTTPEFDLRNRVKIAEYFEDTGGSLTVTIYFLRTDSTTLLQDDEIWFEIDYPNSTDQAQRDRDFSTRVSDPDATPANHTDDDVGTAWTGRGATYKQHKAVSGSISMGVGPVTIWAVLSKSAQTVYVDPLFDIA